MWQRRNISTITETSILAAYGSTHIHTIILCMVVECLLTARVVCFYLFIVVESLIITVILGKMGNRKYLLCAYLLECGYIQMTLGELNFADISLCDLITRRNLYYLRG